MTPNDYSVSARLTFYLFVLEAGIVLIFATLYKAPTLDTSFLTTRFAVLMLVGIGACAAGGAGLFRSRRKGRAIALAISVNLVTVAAALAISETVLRLLERTSGEGVAIGSVQLRPTWPELVDQVRAMPPNDTSFFVYDAELGWSVGPSRRSTDGLYASSAEGIRSAMPGVRYADASPENRVALIGDSNALSLEVPFEDSWGYHMGQLLGDTFQVLNFGVDGYGIDQVYLRYLRDVRPWKPNVVLVGFIQHDLYRSMAVYPFISFGWGGHLVKPRFDLVDNRLVVVNRPLPTPQQIMHAAHPGDLPFINYDPGYVSQDWDWRFERGPLLLRLLTSIWPRWPNAHALGNADAKALNVRLLVELVGAIRRDGATPLLVYLPSRSNGSAFARATLSATRLPYIDMTRCVSRVPKSLRRVPSGAHYSGAGNEAIAQCTAPEVRAATVSKKQN